MVDGYIAKLGGRSVYENDTAVTKDPVTQEISHPCKVKVIDKTGLNVRKGAGVNYPVVCVIKKNEVYTITEEKKVNSAVWGKLKSGAGWINVGEKYVVKI